MSGHERFSLRSADDLLEKARRLKVDLPFAEDIGPLLEPVKVGCLELPNRLAVQPMEGADAGHGGAPSPWTLRRYVRFARGGSGLIWLEAAAMRPEGRSNPRQLVLTRKNLGVWKRLVDTIRREARSPSRSPHNPALILQLSHSGRFSKPQGAARPVIARHHEQLDRLVGIGLGYPLVTDQELDGLSQEFSAAARLAAEAGFDGVDIKACHGYLASELLAAFDRPESHYGGSYDNRTRWVKETFRRIRSEHESLLVTCRLNVYDGPGAPVGFGCSASDGGLTEDLTEPIRLARELWAAGAPLLSITMGIPALHPHIGRPFDLPVRGAPLPDEHPLSGVARHIRITGELQKTAPGLAFLGAGYSWLRDFMPQVAAGAVRGGLATLVGLGRGALAYPEYARDLAEKERLDPRRLCTACSRCSELLRDGGRAGCVVRDGEVYAAEYKKLRGILRRGAGAGRASRKKTENK